METLAAMAKVCRVEGEAAKVSVRHARKAAMDAAKRLASEDERKRAEREVQKLTDAYIEQVGRWLLLLVAGWWSAGVAGACGHSLRLRSASVPRTGLPAARSYRLPPPCPCRCRPQVEDLVARKEQSIKMHDS